MTYIQSIGSCLFQFQEMTTYQYEHSIVKKNAVTSLSQLEIRQSSHFYFRMLHSVYDLCGEKCAIKQRKWNKIQTYRDKKRAHQAMRAFFTLNIITPTYS